MAESRICHDGLRRANNQEAQPPRVHVHPENSNATHIILKRAQDWEDTSLRLPRLVLNPGSKVNHAVQLVPERLWKECLSAEVSVYEGSTTYPCTREVEMFDHVLLFGEGGDIMFRESVQEFAPQALETFLAAVRVTSLLPVLWSLRANPAELGGRQVKARS